VIESRLLMGFFFGVAAPLCCAAGLFAAIPRSLARCGISAAIPNAGIRIVEYAVCRPGFLNCILTGKYTENPGKLGLSNSSQVLHIQDYSAAD
jgi:hypothetical protein